MKVDSTRLAGKRSLGTGRGRRGKRNEEETGRAIWRLPVRSQKRGASVQAFASRGSRGFQNDVALNSMGEAFVTNTGTGEVFRMSPNHDGVEPFLPPNGVLQANGMSVSGDDKVLFVAGWLGVARVDTASRTVKLLLKAENLSVAGLDGMYVYRGSQVGIQNPDLHSGRVMRYYLNSAMDQIQRAEVRESYNPLF